MRADNFIAFFAVFGFFIGLFFVFLADLDALEFVIYVCVITLCFFLVSHVLVMNYVDASAGSKIYFDKARYEEVNSLLIESLNIRERKMDAMIQIKRDKLPKKTKKKSVKKVQNDRDKTQAA